jgi:transglutaminase-like putative cysteine protease
MMLARYSLLGVCVTVISIALSLFALTPHVPAQEPSAPADIDSLSRQIAGDSGSSLDRAQRLITWINTSFDWKATDYQQRTIEQIIERRGGNCAELSRVLERLLKPAGIRYRWVSEINIHPYTPGRQQRAEARVAANGNRSSVFGLRHNDHRWLEVFDDAAGQWVPADPSIGIAGVEAWIKFRMGLANRPQPQVPAVAEILKDMIVPFAVIARSESGLGEDRSEFYLVEQFNRTYGGRLASLPAWRDWTAGVRELSQSAARAFRGDVNLHDSNDKIARLAETYEALRQQARHMGIQ